MATDQRTLIAVVLLALAGVGCGKVSETASEKAAEKVLETAMSTDGTKAKVDLSSGQAKITSTDASGNTTVLEMGGAKVSEAELGVNLYPGATAQEGASSRTTTPEGSSWMAAFDSKDPVDKVAAFYRDQLKAQASGKQFFDNSGPDSAILVLADEQANRQVQVHVTKTETGSSIQVMTDQMNRK